MLSSRIIVLYSFFMVCTGISYAHTEQNAPTLEELRTCITLDTLRNMKTNYKHYASAGEWLRTHLGENGIVQKNLDTVPEDGAIIAAIVNDMKNSYHIDGLEASYRNNRCNAVRRTFAQTPDEMNRSLKNYTDHPEEYTDFATHLDEQYVDGWRAPIIRARIRQDICHACGAIKEHIRQHFSQINRS